MAALPPLSVDVEARIEKFVAGMQAVGLAASTQVAAVEQKFQNLNTKIADWFNDAKIAVDALYVSIGVLAAGFVIFETLKTVIGGARDQLAEMVDIANKAQNFNVSASFLQGWESEAHKLQVSVSDLDSILEHAFQATKEKSPIDLQKWETAGERITEVEKALRVYNETLAKASGTQLQGLVLFRDAADQQAKITAVLQAMKELDAIGQHLASLDLGEHMFGAKFVDDIRLGKTSVDSILESMQKAATSGHIFSDEDVRRAKEIDDKLQMAYDHLSRELKPSWDAIARELLNVKSTYADIVDLSAKLVNSTSNIVEYINKWSKPLSDVLNAINSLVTRQPKAEGDLAAQAGLNDIGGLAGQAGLGDIGKNIPKSRGIGAVPTLKGTDAAEEKSAFDTEIDRLGRATALRQADAQAVGLDAEAHARLRADMTLVNAAAKDGTVLTEAQIETWQAAVNASAAAAKAYEDAQRKFQATNQAMQFGGNELITILDGIRTKSMTAQQAVTNLTNTLVTALEKSLLLGQGPLAGLMGMAPTVSGGTGGLLGGLASLFGRQSGGPASAGGAYLVGEGGPELFVPSMSGTVFQRGSGGGGISIVVNNSSDANVGVGQTRQSSDGSASLEIVVRRAVQNTMTADLANYGPISQGFARRFGADPTRGLG